MAKQALAQDRAPSRSFSDPSTDSNLDIYRSPHKPWTRRIGRGKPNIGSSAEEPSWEFVVFTRFLRY
jgi:hypothetical protein